MAHDEQRSIEAARTYWKALDRPNVMIKIPGTPEGEGAIEQAIYEGINVNVTLLFSVESYQAIAEAYIRGLERRHAEGQSLDVNSVASFFVSRVDTNVDRKLEELGRTDLAGTAALANARAAYRRFKELFSGPRWDTLRDAGAAVQRPLWASTGTKNPHYPDTMYVDGLVAPHTVNTMPMATLLAAADHSEVTGPTAERGPHRRARGARSGGDRHAAGHRGAARRRRQAVRGRDERAAGRDRASAAPRSPPGARRGSSRACRPTSRSRSPSASRRPSATRSPSASGSATRRCGEVPASPRSRIGSAG